MKGIYPKPDFRKGFDLCKKDCPGAEKCVRNGLFFYNDYFYNCPLYETHKKVMAIQKKLEQTVPEGLKDATMENFKPRTQKQKQLVDTIERYFEKAIWREGKGIIMCGPNGIGKTHVAISIYKKLIGQNITAAFASPKLDGSYHDIEEHYKTLAQPKVLIYDDFGYELDRDFILNHLFNLFDKRINNKRGLVATTNLKGETLKYKFGLRIFSRLARDNFIIQLDGNDYRQKMRELF